MSNRRPHAGYFNFVQLFGVPSENLPAFYEDLRALLVKHDASAFGLGGTDLNAQDLASSMFAGQPAENLMAQPMRIARGENGHLLVMPESGGEVIRRLAGPKRG